MRKWLKQQRHAKANYTLVAQRGAPKFIISFNIQIFPDMQELNSVNVMYGSLSCIWATQSNHLRGPAW